MQIGNVTVKRDEERMTVSRASGPFQIFDGEKCRTSGNKVYTTPEYHYFIGADVQGGEVYEFVGTEFKGTENLPDVDTEVKLRELLKKFNGCLVSYKEGDVLLRKGPAQYELGCKDALRFIIPFARVLYSSRDFTHCLIEYDESVVLPKDDLTQLNGVLSVSFSRIYNKLK